MIHDHSLAVIHIKKQLRKIEDLLNAKKYEEVLKAIPDIELNCFALRSRIYVQMQDEYNISKAQGE